MTIDIRLRSEAFLSGGAIPRRHAGDGENISPSLKWDRIPDRALELALIMENKKTSALHWIMYKIPADEVGVPEGVPATGKLEEPYGAFHGRNSFGTPGYRGPSDSKGSGVSQYRFTLYVLDKEITLSADADKEALLKAMQGGLMGSTTLEGVYEG